MNTERDELAAMRGELAELTADAAERDDDDWMTEAADAILAAGYRKIDTLAQAWDKGWDAFASFDHRQAGPYPANPYRSRA